MLQVSFSMALRIKFLLLFFPVSIWPYSSYVTNPLPSSSLIILHVIVICLLHEVEILVEILFLEGEGFLVLPTCVSSDSSLRSLIEVMVQ